MCHDLLNMDGNKYIHEVVFLRSYQSVILQFGSSSIMLSNHIGQVPSKTGGRPEKKEVLLEDHDPIWLELRHAHIADVCMENPPSIYFMIKFCRDLSHLLYLLLSIIRQVSGCMRK